MVLVGADFFGVHPSSTNSTISYLYAYNYTYVYHPAVSGQIMENYIKFQHRKKKHRFEDPRNHHDGYGELIRSVKSHLWHKSSSSHEISWQMTFLVGG